mgnify:FL=1
MPRSDMHQPVFSGPLRQHGAGFGALAAGVGRVAIPLITRYVVPAAKRYVVPAVKKFGRDFVEAAAPELGALFSKDKKSRRQTLKKIIKTTARKQMGGAARKKKAARRLGPPKKREEVQKGKSLNHSA